MEKNHSLVHVFYFDGLSDIPNLEKIIFIIFLALYIFTVMGNGGMIFLITKSSNLHTPMYFFVKHLSFIDIFYSTVIIPRTMSDLLSSDKAISFIACAAQLYFYCFCAMTEFFLLVIMAYDRYAAICKPLLYYVIMREKMCITLTTVCYTICFLSALIHTNNIFNLIYCKSNRIAHFFCDVPPILKLSCSDTSSSELVIFTFMGTNVLVCVPVLIISYSNIFYAIIRINSTEGRKKAFATCSSHLLSTGILFGTYLYMYMRPTSIFLSDQDKVVSVFYTVVIPMLNPIIYSLRNKDVKKAFLKVSKVN
ncbi:olfactory receptor 5AP2-like [Pelobates fuscus]|uniref:olfactory receptor 5AP2-like n=1 Tax=Pelobates fuscus TaxID=191477 RepID=UPI002FE44C8B